MSIFLKSSEFYIGYSNDKEERYKASFSDIGTDIVKLSKKNI